jgi:FkbM family methyltransferase
MFPISLVLPELTTIKIVDVGAMKVGSDAYEQVAKEFSCEVIGFDALPAECEKLNALGLKGRRFLPYVIGDGSAQTLHECAKAHNSSLLEPNMALLEQFTGFAELFRVVATRPVATRRLDDIPEAAGADYLKLDVQGAELMVLDGAADTLRSVLVVHTEAEFAPMYKNQPLFGDLDTRLRSLGFVFHELRFVGKRPFRPFPVLKENMEKMVVSQMLWCDAVYVRDFMAFDRLAPDQLLKIAAIVHEDFGSYDFAGLALASYDRKTGSDLQASYLSYLTAK